MPLVLEKIDSQKVGPFRYRRLKDKVLLTNEVGDYCFLSSLDFKYYLSGKITKITAKKSDELLKKNFIRDHLDFKGLTSKFSSRNSFLSQGPGLHIVVVTLRCDSKCIYCQSGAEGLESKSFDMDKATARKVVDTIFESPNKFITIEFQGGEPLVNFDTVKFIIDYSRKKNSIAKKDLRFALVSNLTFMSDKILNFLLRNKVSICTSLDGHEFLHNRHRASTINSNNYRNTINWVKKINSAIRNNAEYKFKINALTTVTNISLPFYRQIIDEFIKSGLQGIHLRPVSPFGHCDMTSSKLKVSPENFLRFYRSALDYIIKVNKKGLVFFELNARIFLQKILQDKDPNYLDIRSPCGAGIGQLAYNFNGDVYTCDEGRMLSRCDDEMFRLGNVIKHSYEQITGAETIKAVCLASCLDNLPGCCDCAYKPYCGVCPVYNYVTESTIFGKMNNDRCRIQSGIIDLIFEKMQDDVSKEVILKWVKQN